MSKTKFNPDYLCGLPACEANTRGLVAEYQAEIAALKAQIEGIAKIITDRIGSPLHANETSEHWAGRRFETKLILGRILEQSRTKSEEGGK